ncbi:MAG: lipoyl synthase [Chloroflexi bacterium AL-W]|nr:lipoyl synthase [Chloroflexi bacterium AL-N1]NOK71419.1 lipoyl synthase [Chloroflexi bacterium AL-N10]NOK78822.1 lipoyl synthase [Chloroflexi bacterium AL-N5]NOK86240.1 lipoyl synthase [Chloroflexi bacterium AL-W]NOK93144.1 lipoyl synthase [Chloroflexi bacterium AL-N15]
MAEFIPLTPISQPTTTQKATPAPRQRRPEWLKVRAPSGENYEDVLRLIRSKRLHTVCEEAHCPNIGECWNHRTATFLLLGEICTRGCRYCAIGKGKPAALDEDEPERIAETVEHLKLKHAVLTAVNRDDQPDGGAHIFAESIRKIRERLPECRIEVLIPDFEGNWEALKMVMDERPDVLNHNIETVPRLFRRFRPKAGYEQSLELLARAREMVPDAITKSGLMVGAGETNDEVLAVMGDLRKSDVDVITVGQYLAPSLSHWPIDRYVTPTEFEMFKQAGLQRGFRHVESGPLVRSSYHAHEHVPQK